MEIWGHEYPVYNLVTALTAGVALYYILDVPLCYMYRQSRAKEEVGRQIRRYQHDNYTNHTVRPAPSLDPDSLPNIPKLPMHGPSRQNPYLPLQFTSHSLYSIAAYIFFKNLNFRGQRSIVTHSY